MAFFKRNRRVSPARIILLGFIGIILLGALLLMLPFSTREPGGASFADALFTSISATCVTGLVVQDTATYWSAFGQLVILALIQIGGMGVVTVAVSISMFSGKRIGLKQRWVMQESISAPQVGGIVRMTDFILRTTLTIEGVCAVLLGFVFVPQFGLKGIWMSIFHSISAFCNAGFDLMGGETGKFSSLTSYVGNPLITLIIPFLLISGGIGFLTWSDIKEHKFHLHQYRLQSKIVLTMTICLLTLPALYFLFYEFSLPQWADLTRSQKIQAAWFQSASPRTAGFNTVDIARLSEPSKLLTIILMVVGGAPGSTAGGFKNTTLAVFLLAIVTVIRKKNSIQCFGRRFPADLLCNAAAIFTLYQLLFIGGGVLICCVDGVPILDALFETASAIGTVGLSTGITAGLSMFSKSILMFLMYFGRVGGLTMIFALMPGIAPVPSQLPQEKITVG